MVRGKEWHSSEQGTVIPLTVRCAEQRAIDSLANDEPTQSFINAD